ncbi:e9b59b6a-f39c-4d2a-9b94-75afe2ab05bc [Thermothielavioides terrestris]|uniref:E9b59b6a-f39c-4d2a-9b94-75afe2ab05bc n=1 Tax=Thermothielavioides terrestris TaxID=2587410 RepID=A0A3S4AY35_9PEZI|nr:e9b59b6a-f39c-4d2a-9b94-75afe2ab05bc [Thermothielavioides terrestris]
MSANENENAPPVEGQDSSASVQKIQTLLSARDDTSRFVGLALLKSVLDNTPELRSNEDAIAALWESIPPKFLDRLMRTGSKQQKAPDAPRKDANDMLDIAVSILHTFAALLPENARQNPRLLQRIPLLVASLLHCSNDTTRLALETLVSLVSHPDGAQAFTAIDDISPLTEVASSQPLVLDTLLYAWLNATAAGADKTKLRSKMDATIGSLVSSFKGTDAVTLLAFLGSLLPRLEPEVLPSNPKWLPSLAQFISDLVARRPTAAGRAAFTNVCAALLEAYPSQAPQLLFAEQGNKTDNPSSYLLINLLLVDLRATLPTLLEQLNNPSYAETSRRLASAFNVVSHFIGYLVRSMDDNAAGNLPWVISPDLLLKLRKAISETMSLTTEYLRDRWDASVAGAMGLHPDARVGAANTAAGSHFTLAWDSKSDSAASADDPLILAAVRALAIWLREDDNDFLRKEAAGLADMLIDLYRSSSSSSSSSSQGRLDFRRPVLVAFEGIIVEKKGRAAFLDNGGWQALADDLVAVLEASSAASDENEAARGIEVVRVLLQIAESERPGPREAWMDLVTRVAAWYAPEAKQPAVVEECQVAALQLVTALLANTHPGMQKRYVHSTSAVLGIANQLKGKISGDPALEEALEDVLGTLAALR